MKEIAIIGRIAVGKELFDGQTILTRMFKNELEEQTKKRIICVDTFEYKKNFVKCFFKTFYVLFKCDNIFVLLSRNGLSFYLPFLYYMNKVFKKKIYHRVIGGCLQDLIKQHKNWDKYLNAMTKNYVETNNMKKALEELGISNVVVSPNFKKINIISENEIEIGKEGKIYKFCTFSRVVKEKGIDEAIKAIDNINQNGEKVYLDIYGPIDEKYKEEFWEEIKNKKYINYKGIIDPSETVEVLKKYYMLLFPTRWQGEGFPGTFIDAFSSGVPIIATKWNYNHEIIKNNDTGIIYSDNETLEEKINFAIKNPNDIFRMKKECLKEAELYRPNNVIAKIINDL